VNGITIGISAGGDIWRYCSHNPVRNRWFLSMPAAMVQYARNISKEQSFSGSLLTVRAGRGAVDIGCQTISREDIGRIGQIIDRVKARAGKPTITKRNRSR
jgi:hypothetical protein